MASFRLSYARLPNTTDANSGDPMRLRLRRNRKAPWSRALVRETVLLPSNLIWPLFITEGESVPVATMSGIMRWSLSELVERACEAKQFGIPALALFPCTPSACKDETGSEALNPDNLLCRALRLLKEKVPEIGLIADIALDPYTSHGHDGLLENGRILNDATITVLARQALILAKAGADILAPSDMMDGRVGAIREALEENGFFDVQILAYAAKYASAFYGPFRDAVGSQGVLSGDKATYQMDPANAREALLEARLDAEEGADMLMVKPGLPYLDILHALSQETDRPLFAYQVSGEYAMIEAAAQNGWIDGEKAMLESLIALRRAGADAILTYYAPKAARLLQERGRIG
jgi:porphobilinogen synthase